MYTDKEREMVFLVVSRKEIAQVKHKIHTIDKDAFVVVVDAYETYGDGFKQFDPETEKNTNNA
ncbi:MAG: YitT family protein, partial [Tidjanibacter sp.]|nr:YitT family protein [Tidjanibacter sp.]